ncbi:MAG: hypothetical protein EXS16_12265 [Gemmataceae bacterium]|nr:hypothetical protein [Gemmataceae bacterium]
MQTLTTDTADHEPPAQRVRRHLVRVAVVANTIFVTAWCYQMHIFLGITATFLAKHILVAVLVAGMRVPIRDDKK